MKIGVCGGTFDPFHLGHVEPLMAVRETMGWERVLYVPAYRQPFKDHGASVSGYHRFAMAAAATLALPGVEVLDLELARGATSYTVDTLQSLRTTYGADVTLDWIIGDDSLSRLLEWKDLDRIFTMANFVVLARHQSRELPGDLATRVTDASGRPVAGAIVFAPNATVPISSTDIRQRIQRGDAIDQLVDPYVSRYIEHYGLYGKGQRDTLDD